MPNGGCPLLRHVSQQEQTGQSSESAAPATVVPLVEETERVALIIALREHPEWTLGDLMARARSDDPRAATLRRLTLRELMTPPGGYRVRLALARRATGEEFVEFVYRVLVEAGRPVGASYLRGQLGGPRWKLQGALRELVEQGRVTRSGTTSDTKYQAREQPGPAD